MSYPRLTQGSCIAAAFSDVLASIDEASTVMDRGECCLLSSLLTSVTRLPHLTWNSELYRAVLISCAPGRIRWRCSLVRDISPLGIMAMVSKLRQPVLGFPHVGWAALVGISAVGVLSTHLLGIPALLASAAAPVSLHESRVLAEEGHRARQVLCVQEVYSPGKSSMSWAD